MALATSQPLAAQVGLGVLQRGGNAIDAAIATAATLTVVEPTMNGLGSDLFALVWDGQQLHGLNASGRAPRRWTPERFRGRRSMPELGWDAVTVPGAVSGWAALWQRFGSQPFETLLAPAIDYAESGFPVLPVIAAAWRAAEARFRDFPEFRRVFLPGGAAPRAGAWFRSPELGASLRGVAASEGRDFYHGALAERIARASERDGGLLELEDLKSHRADWVEPLSVDFHGARVYELPPNGQGLATLIALGVLEHLPISELPPEHPDSVHLQLEAMKLAFRDCHRNVADPARMRLPVEELLAESRLRALAARVRLDCAAPHSDAPTPDHGTVYLTSADADGRMVSLIQSNYMGFGSGVVVPGTGISLQNRGVGFSLDPSSPNLVTGGARPYHTIMPGFVLHHGRPFMSLGVMGGHMQPQGHTQLVLRALLHRQNPQTLCDAPRWYVSERSEVALEPELSLVAGELARRGHVLLEDPPSSLFGGAQVIARLERGYAAGSDPRKDGQALAC